MVPTSLPASSVTVKVTVVPSASSMRPLQVLFSLSLVSSSQNRLTRPLHVDGGCGTARLAPLVRLPLSPTRRTAHWFRMAPPVRDRSLLGEGDPPWALLSDTGDRKWRLHQEPPLIVMGGYLGGLKDHRQLELETRGAWIVW